MLSLLLTACSTLAVPTPLVVAPRATVASAPQDEAKAAEWDQKLKAAGTDVAKLFELAEWCKENKLRTQQQDTYKRILELDANNEEAHKALRHHFYDGQWFETYAALSVYKREETKRMEEKGLTKVGEEWIAIADAPYVRMGWTKGEDGKYRSKAAAEKLEREKQLIADGWQQQYLEWVHPDDFEKWRQGLFKCGDEWLELAKADEYHAQVFRWWVIPTDHFIVRSTCDHATSVLAAANVEVVVPHLVRLFGKQPEAKPFVTVLNSIAQYNTYAAGDPAASLPPSEANGYSSCHFAFFAERQADYSVNPPEPNQGGVAYWDAKDPANAPFGEYAVRHAAALSWIEAIDPSWDAVSRFIASPGDGQFPEAAFWAEKKIPRWIRYGAASYVERWAPLSNGANQWANRTWAMQNLATHGALDPFETIFTFALDPAVSNGKLIGESGLLVSFMLDSDCKPVRDAQQKLKALLQRGESCTEAVAELQQAIVDNKAAFEAYVTAIKG